MRAALLTVLFSALLSQVACATQVSQAKVAAAGDGSTVARADALNVMPEAICKRLEDCKQIGKEHKYPTMDDCRSEQRAVWTKLWSEEKCGGTHAVVAGKLRECEQRASTYACGGNVLDLGGLVTECGGADVCK